MIHHTASSTKLFILSTASASKMGSSLSTEEALPLVLGVATVATLMIVLLVDFQLRQSWAGACLCSQTPVSKMSSSRPIAGNVASNEVVNLSQQGTHWPAGPASNAYSYSGDVELYQPSYHGAGSGYSGGCSSNPVSGYGNGYDASQFNAWATPGGWQTFANGANGANGSSTCHQQYYNANQGYGGYAPGSWYAGSNAYRAEGADACGGYGSGGSYGYCDSSSYNASGGSTYGGAWHDGGHFSSSANSAWATTGSGKSSDGYAFSAFGSAVPVPPNNMPPGMGSGAPSEWSV